MLWDTHRSWKKAHFINSGWLPGHVQRTHTCICTHAYMCMHTLTRAAHMHAHTCAYTCTCTYVRTHTHVHTCTHTCCTHARTHTHTMASASVSPFPEGISHPSDHSEVESGPCSLLATACPNPRLRVTLLCVSTVQRAHTSAPRLLITQTPPGHVPRSSHTVCTCLSTCAHGTASLHPGSSPPSSHRTVCALPHPQHTRGLTSHSRDPSEDLSLAPVLHHRPRSHSSPALPSDLPARRPLCHPECQQAQRSRGWVT